MTGYQEVLTDPSYRGQIVAMTYPLIGNYGVNRFDDESDAAACARFRDRGTLRRRRATGAAQESLDDYLKRWNIPGIQGIDTRALTKHLRTRGAMRAVITSDGRPPWRRRSGSRRTARRWPAAISSRKSRRRRRLSLGRSATLESRRWGIPNPTPGHRRRRRDGAFAELPPAKHRIVAYDFGMKRNILRRLRQEGFEVRGRARDDHRRGSARAEARRRLPLQRPRRSRGARLHPREVKQAGRQEADLRHLPRPPDSRPRVRRKDLQAEVRPSRRQPAGEGSAHRQGRHHRAEPRLRRRSDSPALERRGHAHQSQRPHRRRPAPPGLARLQRAVPSRGRAGAARRQLFLRGVRRSDRGGPDSLLHSVLPPAPVPARTSLSWQKSNSPPRTAPSWNSNSRSIA